MRLTIWIKIHILKSVLGNWNFSATELWKQKGPNFLSSESSSEREGYSPILQGKMQVKQTRLESLKFIPFQADTLQYSCLSWRILHSMEESFPQSQSMSLEGYTDLLLFKWVTRGSEYQFLNKSKCLSILFQNSKPNILLFLWAIPKSHPNDNKQ